MKTDRAHLWELWITGIVAGALGMSIGYFIAMVQAAEKVREAMGQ